MGALEGSHGALLRFELRSGISVCTNWCLSMQERQEHTVSSFLTDLSKRTATVTDSGPTLSSCSRNAQPSGLRILTFINHRRLRMTSLQIESLNNGNHIAKLSPQGSEALRLSQSMDTNAVATKQVIVNPIISMRTWIAGDA